MTPLLSLKSFGLALRRAGRAPLALVQDVDLELAPGHCALLMGESGAGKSSLLLGLSGLVDPDQCVAQGGAELRALNQRWVLPQDAEAARGRGLVFLPQDPASRMDPAQSALSTVREALGNHGGNEDAAALLHSVGLTDAACALRAHELSVGMAQRVLLAAALATRAPLLVLDEPTSALDRTNAAALAALLRGLLAQGTALLVATHDLPFAQALGGELHFLCGGRVVERAPVGVWTASPRHPLAQRFVRAARGESADAEAPCLAPPLRPRPALRGCVFADRCPLVQDACRRERPSLRAAASGHAWACPLVLDGKQPC